MVILDFGSGNTCKNSPHYVRRMIDALAEIDTHKRDVVIKWQLFQPESAPHCTPLDELVFAGAYSYAAERGYKTTASVFDEYSLRWLLANFDVPFVKIAARDWAYPLLEQTPRGVPVVVSVTNCKDWWRFAERENVSVMACVAQYPAPVGSYEAAFEDRMLRCGVSDHSPSLYLWKEYVPSLWERHFALDDSEGADAGAFASRPRDLAGVL